MKISGIYQIQSRIKPERLYIGSSNNIKSRWNLHLSELRRNKHSNGKLQNHYNKYGKNDLIFSILICCDEDSLIIAEQFYIDSHKTFFNLCKKAGSTLGRKRTLQQRKKMSEVMLGRNTWSKGSTCSEETKKIHHEHGKINYTKTLGSVPWNKGKKGLQVAWNKGLHVGNSMKEPILQYDTNGNFIKEWDCAATAGRELSIAQQCIRGCAKGKYKKGGGFVWKLKEPLKKAT